MKVPDDKYLQKNNICFFNMGGNEICGKKAPGCDYLCAYHRKTRDLQHLTENV